MRTRFDSLAKDLWKDALGDVGRVTAELEVTSPPQRADATFEPDPIQRAALRARGLLGRMALGACMLEAFHGTPDPEDVRDCHRKYLAWRRSLGEDRDGALLWLVVSGDPRRAKRDFQLRRLSGWPEGVFSAAPGFGLRAVSVAALPATRDTLALRLFGQGAVLREAAREVLALPEDAWERRLIPVLLQWRTQIPELPERRTTDEEDFVSNAQQILDEWERRATHKGLSQGLSQGRSEGLAPLVRLFERRLSRPLTETEREGLRSRLGSLGPERLGDVVLDLSPAELGAWLADPAAR
ncbi:MAG: hypothetical protein HY909_31895 [Deltaproteobacteria bacterium]|nr:hypothetical protein [Deltaproteobacteria bacterium]